MFKFRTINIILVFSLLLLLAYHYYNGFSWWGYGVVLTVYVICVTYGSAVLSAQFFLPVKYAGDRNSNAIAITFDDGPIPGRTEEILEILSAHGVLAAFFCIGNRVTDNPGLVRQIHDRGHLIGNHSYWHKPTFDLQSSEQIASELTGTDRAIKDIIGVKPAFFRPPFGVTNPMVARAVHKGNYCTIGWSVRSFDTVITDGTVLLHRITRNLKGGDVILLHDYSNTTLAILPQLLGHIKKLGLKIVRVDELLNENAYA